MTGGAASGDAPITPAERRIVTAVLAELRARASDGQKPPKGCSIECRRVLRQLITRAEEMADVAELAINNAARGLELLD